MMHLNTFKHIFQYSGKLNIVIINMLNIVIFGTLKYSEESSINSSLTLVLECLLGIFRMLFTTGLNAQRLNWRHLFNICI